MVFLDMGGICCIKYIGNYYTIMRYLKCFKSFYELNRRLYV